MIRRRPNRIAIALVASLSLPACGVVEIVEPAGTRDANGLLWASAPVTPLTVNVLNRYNGNFSADVDYKPVGPFAPTPAQNVTVSTPGPECFQAVGSPVAYNPARYRHDFIARGDSVDSSAIGNDVLEFVPPSLHVQPAANINIGLNQSRTVTVALVPGPTAPLQVVLAPNQPTVSVNGNPAGAAVSATFPPSAAGTFTITGVSLGGFIVMVKARGVQCAGVSGQVLRG